MAQLFLIHSVLQGFSNNARIQETAAAERISNEETLKDRLTLMEDVVLEAHASTRAMIKATHSVSANARSVTSTSNRHLSAVPDAASSADGIKTSMLSTLDGSQHTNRISGEAADKAQETRSTVETAIGSMKSIADRICVIQEIARQTDLLAPNAAVKAARAANTAGASPSSPRKCASWRNAATLP